jgi:polar amino acid transport system permease protein
LEVKAVERLLESFLNPEVMRASAPYLVQGLWMTAKLCALVVPLGVLGGLLLAVLHSLRRRWLSWCLVVWVDLFRAFPPLVLLVLVYYGLPYLGIELSPLLAVALAFTLNTSSYYGEILRAGVESVPEGQWEAARSTGLGRGQTLGHVVLPQAVRSVLPDLVGNTLEVVKLTSVASVVALPELLRMARVAQGIAFNPTPLILAAGLYFLLLWPLVRLLSRMERGMPARAA